MWRSLFLAVGIGLMLLGGEALVFERAVINQSARLPGFLNGLFEKNGSNGIAFAGNAPVQGNPAFQIPNASNFQRTPYSPASNSSFGPSRFSGPQSGGYGGPRVDLSRSGFNSNNVNAYPASYSNGVNAANGGVFGAPNQIRGPRTLVTKDWMPWSLLATGAIIFLYTSSYGRRDRSEY